MQQSQGVRERRAAGQFRRRVDVAAAIGNGQRLPAFEEPPQRVAHVEFHLVVQVLDLPHRRLEIHEAQAVAGALDRAVERQVELEHAKFKAEDTMVEELEAESNTLFVQLTKLKELQYNGNFGNRDNWFRSKIPQKFDNLVAKYGYQVVKDALNNLRRENEVAIENSSTLVSITKERDRIFRAQQDIISAKHREIHQQLTAGYNGLYDTKQRIVTNLKSIEDKSWFIKFCLMRSEVEKRGKRMRLHGKAVEECTEAIRRTK